MTQLPDVKKLHDDSHSVAEFALSVLSKHEQAGPSANPSEVEEQLDAAAALAGLLERPGAAERIGNDLLGRAAERIAALAVRVSGEFDSEVAPSYDANSRFPPRVATLACNRVNSRVLCGVGNYVVGNPCSAVSNHAPNECRQSIR
jgi:hypothetical protein